MIKVTCAIILQKNKLLITQRGADSDHPFLWEFPGGKIEEGELPENCIYREIKEELDIDVVILEKMQAVQFDYGFKKIELIPFLCVLKKLRIKLSEHKQYKWIHLHEIEKTDFLEADKLLLQNKKNQNILEKYLGEKMDNS